MANFFSRQMPAFEQGRLVKETFFVYNPGGLNLKKLGEGGEEIG